MRLALICALALVVSCKRFQRGHADAGADAEAPIATLDAAAPADAGPAASYRSDSSGFRVEFPEGKPPEVEDKTLPKAAAAVRLFKVQYGSAAYIVVAEEMAGSRTAQQMLDGAREGLLESTGSTAQSDVPVTLGSYHGFELVLSATTSGLTMRQRVRVVTSGQRLFQLLVVAPEWSGSTPLEQRFFDSFNPDDPPSVDAGH